MAPSAGNVQDGFSKSVAGVASVLKCTISVQGPGSFEIIRSDLNDNLRVIGILHGCRRWEKPGLGIAGYSFEVVVTVGFKCCLCKLGRMDVDPGVDRVHAE